MKSFIGDPGGHETADPGGWSSLYGPGGGMGKQKLFGPVIGITKDTLKVSFVINKISILDIYHYS